MDRDTDALQAALVDAAGFYADRLAASPAAQAYLREHGIDPASPAVAAAEIGYAPSRGLAAHLDRHGVAPAVAEAAGLTRERDGRRYDYFRNRIVWPIRDRGGLPIGFIGRDLSGTSPAKWVNSPTTAVFDKGATLLGIDDVADVARAGGTPTVALVEGPSDKSALQTLPAGAVPWDAVAAASGTALTAAHLAQLREVCGTDPALWVAFDGDSAGAAAARRAWDLLVEARWQAPVTGLPWPAGSDPADLVAAGPDRVLAHLAAAPRPLASLIVEHTAQSHRSFDGSYFVPQATSAIIARLRPAWEAGMDRDDLQQAMVDAHQFGTDPLVLFEGMADPLPDIEPSPGGPGNEDAGPVRAPAPAAEPGGRDRARLRQLAHGALRESASREDFLDQLAAAGVHIRLRHRGTDGPVSGYALALDRGDGAEPRFFPASAVDRALTWPRLARLLPDRAEQAATAARIAAVTGPPAPPRLLADTPAARALATGPGVTSAAFTDRAARRLWVFAAPTGTAPADTAAAEAAGRIAAIVAGTESAERAVAIARDAATETFGPQAALALAVVEALPGGRVRIATSGPVGAWSDSAAPEILHRPAPGAAIAVAELATAPPRLLLVPHVGPDAEAGIAVAAGAPVPTGGGEVVGADQLTRARLERAAVAFGAAQHCHLAAAAESAAPAGSPPWARVPRADPVAPAAPGAAAPAVASPEPLRPLGADWDRLEAAGAGFDDRGRAGRSWIAAARIAAAWPTEPVAGGDFAALNTALAAASSRDCRALFATVGLSESSRSEVVAAFAAWTASQADPRLRANAQAKLERAHRLAGADSESTAVGAAGRRIRLAFALRPGQPADLAVRFVTRQGTDPGDYLAVLQATSPNREAALARHERLRTAAAALEVAPAQAAAPRREPVPTGPGGEPPSTLAEGADPASLLREAIGRRQAVVFDYPRVDTGEVWPRQVEPWALESRGGRLYLAGRDRRMDQARCFRLDRISNVRAEGAAAAFADPEPSQVARALPQRERRQAPRRWRPGMRR